MRQTSRNRHLRIHRFGSSLGYQGTAAELKIGIESFGLHPDISRGVCIDVISQRIHSQHRRGLKTQVHKRTEG